MQTHIILNVLYMAYKWLKWLGLGIVYTALVATLAAGVMGIQWLRSDNQRLEDQRNQLVVQSQMLNQRVEELQAEGELLKSAPLQ